MGIYLIPNSPPFSHKPPSKPMRSRWLGSYVRPSRALPPGRGCLSRGHDRTVPRNGSGEPAWAWSPAWDMVAGGSLQWLPARVMSDLPRWHTQRSGGRCQKKTPATSIYLRPDTGPTSYLVRLRVRPERHRAQSCTIALRSPAPERSSDLKRYSPDIHARNFSENKFPWALFRQKTQGAMRNSSAKVTPSKREAWGLSEAERHRRTRLPLPAQTA